MTEILEEKQEEQQIPVEEAVFEQESAPQPERPEQKRKRVPLISRTSAKVTAFILAILMVFTCIGGTLAAIFMVEEGIYTIPRREYIDFTIGDMIRSDAWQAAECIVIEEDEAAAREKLKYTNIARMELRSESGEVLWTYDSGAPLSKELSFESKIYRWGRQAWLEDYLTYWLQGEENRLVETLGATVTLAEGLPEGDDYALAYKLISAAYYFRYSVYVIIAVSAILTIACYIFLLCASGHHPDHDGVRPGWGTRIPVDLLTTGVGLTGVCIVALIIEAARYSEFWFYAALLVGGGIALAVMFLGWSMSMALRIKLGGWWRNSITWQCLRLCAWVCRGCWRGVRAVYRGTATLAAGIPLVWKIMVLFLGLSLVEFMVILVYSWEAGPLIRWWLLEKVMFLPLVLAVSLMLRRLEQGGKAIAEGDLNYQIETKKLLPVFRRHAENLNCIGEGMNRAVEERTRSERMKTELITNVSHDIKTPLTSIINYADLIEKEPQGSEKIAEYAQVLHRQSDRLKRLIDDLVEASKASTGNLDITLVPCEVGVLLTQTAGEYEYRLRERGMELVTRQPETPLKIMADGRRLWRVFDNLMSNVCKYGQSGTRVYLTLEKRNGQAVISFKNISREELDLTPEELMERFVRGDASRKSEGSGLGLSIARSLTELQRGKMDVTVDGDLFKVELRFPIIP